LWRRQEILEAVEGHGGGQRLWRRSKAPEATNTKLLKTAGSFGGGRRLWSRSEALEEVNGSGSG
jgi:hypothetical protein